MQKKARYLMLFLFLIGVITYQILFLIATLNDSFFSAYSVTINYVSYVISATACLIVAILIYVEIRHLEEFNIDKFTVITFILFSLPRLVFWNGFLLILTVITCIIPIIAFIFKKPKIMKTNLRWALVGIAAGIIAVVLITQVELLMRKEWLPPHILQNSLAITAIIHILQELSVTSISEEILFRGFIWGYLKREGWGEDKAIWAQGVVFWLVHFGKLVTPFTFFLSLPVLIIISCYVTKRSKQVFPAILSHTIINSVSAILYLSAF